MIETAVPDDAAQPIADRRLTAVRTKLHVIELHEGKEDALKHVLRVGNGEVEFFDGHTACHRTASALDFEERRAITFVKASQVFNFDTTTNGDPVVWAYEQLRLRLKPMLLRPH